MSKALSQQLYNEIHDVVSWEDSDHLWFKKEDRNIDSKQVANVLKEGEIIEYNLEGGDRRVLLKDSSGVCIVVDLDTHHIVTTFSDKDSNGRVNPRKYLFGM